MARLGEAYVQVRADLKQFGKDLDAGIKTITDRFERAINRDLGRRLGNDLGTGTREGITNSLRGAGEDFDRGLRIPANNAGRKAGRNFKDGLGDELKKTDVISKSLAALISALEDGFSALPVELKAVVGGVLLAAVIPAGALAGAALGTALIAGVNAAGVALAFQFDQVSNRGKDFAEDLRKRLVNDAQAFGSATINAIDLIDYRLEQMDGTFRNVFTRASQYLLPLTDGVIKAVDGIFEGIDRGLQHADFAGISTELRGGVEDIGIALGDAFDAILSNPDLDVALGDLLDFVRDLVYVGGEFINWTVTAWAKIRPLVGAVQDTADAVGYLLSALNKLVRVDPGALEDIANFFKVGQDGDRAGGAIKNATDDLDLFTRQVGLTVSATDDEIKALQDLNKAFDIVTKGAKDAITSQVDYEEAIDVTNEALKKTKGTLDVDEAAGRTNITNIQKRIEKLGEYTKAQVDSGKLTNEAAQKYYDQEIERLRKEFDERGGNLKQFDELFGKYTTLAGLPPIPDKTAPIVYAAGKAKTAFEKLEAAIRNAYNAARKAPGGISGNIKVQGGTQLFADGGFVTQPTSAILGEGYRKEVVLPLTQPQRSMQLLAQSPLAGAIGGAPPIVYAYFDGEPFQARIVRTAQGVNKRAARGINQVPRNI